MLGRTRLSIEEKTVYSFCFLCFGGLGLLFFEALVNILTLMIDWFEVKAIFQKIKYFKLDKKIF